MKRFIVFPLALGVVGAFFPLVSWGEGVIAQWPVFPVGPFPGIFGLAKDVFAATMPYGVAVGAAMGIGLAVCDKVRNRNRYNSAQLLLANLFWCLLYATLIAAINCALCAVTLLLTIDFTQFPFAGSSPLLRLLAGIFVLHSVSNFTAILWAAIRAITTDDVLTPRVLRDKLRRSSRLS